MEGALVVVVLEDAGRPSAVVEGKGSVSRKVGKADVSDISFCERAWVGSLAGAMAIVYRCAVRRWMGVATRGAVAHARVQRVL